MRVTDLPFLASLAFFSSLRFTASASSSFGSTDTTAWCSAPLQSGSQGVGEGEVLRGADGGDGVERDVSEGRLVLLTDVRSDVPLRD